MEKVKKNLDLSRFGTIVKYIGEDLEDSCLDADLEALTNALPGLLKVMYDCNNQDREDIEIAVSAITWTIANLRDIHREVFG